jgi:hypothetical protein
MKTCLIYGHNGLDLDVTFNLVAFYKKLGFKTFFSGKLYDANLLVVVRAVDKPIDLSVFHYSLIHVFDYGGWNYDGFVNSIDHNKCYIFCTAESKRKRIIEQLHFPKDHIFVAFPPVETSLWIAKNKRVKYEFVHIGNYKPMTDNDPFKNFFLQAITKFKVNIWGIGWALSEKKIYHGKAGLFEVSSIYAQSRFACGLMYPFQRDVTFSGRFWHAPLNGCYLFSEPGLYTQLIPGVIETDYSIEQIRQYMLSCFNRNILQKTAIEFWKTQNNHLQSLISPTLVLMTQDDINQRRLQGFIFIRLSCINHLKLFYQKLLFFSVIDVIKSNLKLFND